MPFSAYAAQVGDHFAQWRIESVLLDFIEQGFVADAKTCSRQLTIPIASLKCSLDFLALGIILEASHERLEVTVGAVALVCLFGRADRETAPL